MAINLRWRQEFTQLCEGALAALQLPKEKTQTDLSSACKFEFDILGSRFDAMHFPEGGDRFVVQCRVGRLTKKDSSAAMKKLLICNQRLARESGAMFALDVANDTVIFSMLDSLVQLQSVDEFVNALKGTATAANQWKKAGLVRQQEV